MEPYFDHERLEVYQMARRFNREVHILLQEVAAGNAEPKDNLRRAAMSITRNIAEGAGRWKIQDKAHFYHIARASATECASCIDELDDFGVLDTNRTKGAREPLARVVAMLISMVRSLEGRDGKSMTMPMNTRRD